MYYHERFDIEKEKKCVDADYDATIKTWGGEEKAKKNSPNNYFLRLLIRDVINAVLGEDLGKSLEEVVKHSEEAFRYSPQIGTNIIKIIIREYLIASGYLGRLGEALKIVNGDFYLRQPFLSMNRRTLLGLYSLFHYLTGWKFHDMVREYAKELLSSVKLTVTGEPICSKAISEIQRGLVGYLGLNESEALNLIYIFLNSTLGTIALLSLGRLLSDLEVVKDLARCLAEHSRGAIAELLRKVSEAGNEEEFKDTLVRLAMYLSY